MLSWGNNGNNSFQFSAFPVSQTNLRRRVPGKIRARQLNKARYNPMKTKRPNTPEILETNMDTKDMDKTKTPLSVKVCERFRPSCLFYKQSVVHTTPLESQTGQIKTGLGDIQIHKSKQGRLTFCQTGTCPNPNLTFTLNQK